MDPEQLCLLLLPIQQINILYYRFDEQYYIHILLNSECKIFHFKKQECICTNLSKGKVHDSYLEFDPSDSLFIHCSYQHLHRHQPKGEQVLITSSQLQTLRCLIQHQLIDITYNFPLLQEIDEQQCNLAQNPNTFICHFRVKYVCTKCIIGTSYCSFQLCILSVSTCQNPLHRNNIFIVSSKFHSYHPRDEQEYLASSCKVDN
jgi:hypothetical protein